jgi:hypothetical protein
MEDRHADISRKLRADLEAERSRSKQIIREKTAELRQLKQEAAHDKERALDQVSKKLQAEKSAELKALRDSLVRQKEQELRHMIKYKDEEIKQIREQLVKDKTSAMRHAAAEARKDTMDAVHEQLTTEKARLLNEVWDLRDQKIKLEDEVKMRRDSERQATETLRRKRQEWEVEKEQLLKQSRMEATRDYQQLRLAERVVQQKEQEMMQYQQHARILEVEKESLGEELTRYKEAESWEKRSTRSKNDSGNDGVAEGPTSLNKHPCDDREKELLQKISRLTKHMRVLEERNTSLKSENSTLKQQSEKSDENGRQNGQQEEKDKLRKLRQRNRELVALARRLEDEKKALKEGCDLVWL